MSLLEELSASLQKGNVEEVQAGVNEALEEGLKPEDVLNEGLLAGMNEMGIKFKNNEVYVPEVLIAARAMKAGMEILRPHLISAGVKSKGKIVLGTVEGDLHDIGKNLVVMMLEGAGFEVIDLGIDVSAERFVEAVKEYKPDILGMSALLTTTMPEMKSVIKELNKAGVRDEIYIMIGGAPVTDNFAEEIGADAYAMNAATAAEVAKSLVG